MESSDVGEEESQVKDEEGTQTKEESTSFDEHDEVGDEEPMQTDGEGEKDAVLPIRRVFEHGSTESQELILQCIEVVKLYYARYRVKAIPRMRMIELLDLIRVHGVPIRQKKLRRLQIPKLTNLSAFLDAISDVEEAIGCYRWDLEYISSPSLFGWDPTLQPRYSIRVIRVLREVFKGVIKRDWPRVSNAIKTIPLYPPSRVGDRDHYISLRRSFASYFPMLYLAVLQRHLESGLSNEYITLLFQQTALQFSKIFPLKEHFNDNSLLYGSTCAMHQLANGDAGGAEAIMNRGWRAHDPEWSRVFSLYRYCVFYELWLEGRNPYHSETLFVPDHDIANLFASNLDSLVNNAREDSEVMPLLPMYVHLSKVLDQVDELIYQMEVLCERSPALIGHVCELLRRFQLHDQADRLVRKFLNPRTALTLDGELLLDVIEQNSQRSTDVIAYNLQFLFNFLDQGRNRLNERAWTLLFSNMTRLSDANKSGMLEGMWEARSAWWPQFHSVPLATKEARKTRRTVFRVLDSVSS